MSSPTDPVPDPFSFERLHALRREGRLRDALNFVAFHLENLLHKGQFAACDAVLAAVVLDDLDPLVALGFLTWTKPARADLPSRAALVARMQPWLIEKIGVERATTLLQPRD